MKIDAIIKEKSATTAGTTPADATVTIATPTAAGASATASTNAGAAPLVGAPPAVPPVALQSLLDMGFSREASAEALVYHANNVEQAADYLLAVQPDRTMRSGALRMMDTDADPNDDDLMSQAIAMSIGEGPVTGGAAADGAASSSTTTTTTTTGIPTQRVPMLTGPTSQQLEALINRALPLCIDLVDFAPECVFKVADLITVIAKRNGPEWRVKLIKTLAKDAVNFAAAVIEHTETCYVGGGVLAEAALDGVRATPESQKLSARLHLLCILIQENYDECGAILDSDNLVPLLISLISVARRVQGLFPRGSELAPKWLAFTFLILDAYEKICTSAKRRRVIQQYYAPTWKWLDV